MGDELLIEHALLDAPPYGAVRPHLTVAAAVVTALISAAVCVVAILAPAPAAAIPLVVVISIGCPIFAGWNVPLAVARLRAHGRARRDPISQLRASLEQLPEVEHPLGL
jgi:hypothetical protein